MDKQKTGELIKNARIKKGYTQVELGGSTERTREKADRRLYSITGLVSMAYIIIMMIIANAVFNKYMILIAAIVIIELLAVYIVRFCVTSHRHAS